MTMVATLYSALTVLYCEETVKLRVEFRKSRVMSRIHELYSLTDYQTSIQHNLNNLLLWQQLLNGRSTEIPFPLCMLRSLVRGMRNFLLKYVMYGLRDVFMYAEMKAESFYIYFID